MTKIAIVVIFFFLYGGTHGMWKFQVQWLNLIHSCNRCYCWGNATSFNSLCPARARTHTSTATRATEVRFLTHRTTVGTPDITWLHFIRYVFWVRNSKAGNCPLLFTICRGFLNIYMTICKFTFQENFGMKTVTYFWRSLSFFSVLEGWMYFLEMVLLSFLSFLWYCFKSPSSRHLPPSHDEVCYMKRIRLRRMLFPPFHRKLPFTWVLHHDI